MFSKSSSSQAVRRFVFAIAALALVSVAGFYASYALPSQEVETIYYSNASKTTEVGYRLLTCSGERVQWGTTSAYYDRTTTPCPY